MMVVAELDRTAAQTAPGLLRYEVVARLAELAWGGRGVYRAYSPTGTHCYFMIDPDLLGLPVSEPEARYLRACPHIRVVIDPREHASVTCFAEPLPWMQDYHRLLAAYPVRQREGVTA